ncbi:hypothetical protein Gohar_015205, partial [Gossypium harknessii]|nr:hypothetical protein [Gossypium harknessii]
MACFLLPKTLCEEMEAIIAKFWWEKGHAELGNLPSLTWKSIWAAKKLLIQGLSWRIGRGNNVSIWTDRWIPGIEPSTWQNGNENRELKTVSDLIDGTSKKWKTEIIFSTFQVEIAQKILKIPLAETDSEDLRVWKGEATGEFSVRSAY